jgi:hypothetical protein
MKMMHKLTILSASVLAAIALPAWSQDLGSQPNDSAKTCQQALAKAKAAVKAMPEGVEKASAQKEIAAAADDMASGNIISCNTHAKNAAGATSTKVAH